jgi:type I restriction-modification system DNA methylase subunit
MPQPARAPTSSIWPRTCSGCRRRRAGRTFRPTHLQANAKQPSIGKLIDEAMAAIEVANPGLKGVLPKDYNRPALDR